jgi:ParB family transcriptional regulator, chromosome partitioning protein
MAKPALGRGLGALLGGVAPAGVPTTVSVSTNTPSAAEPALPAGQTIQRVAVARIHPCPFQPRKDFSEESLRELADSIKEQGVIQPLIVRRRGDAFELIAGERRWRAAQVAGLAELPVIVREADDREVLELALIENLQRENLNPIEEALGYSQLIEQFRLTQEEASTRVGKSRAVVANALRLLRLAPELQAHVRDGRLSVGHAKVIMGLTAEEQKVACVRVLKDGLSVRETEELVGRMQQRPATPGSGRPASAPVGDVHISDLENKLRQHFGTKVQLKYRQGKGSVEIRFFSDDDLDRILKLTGVPLDE